MRMRTSMIRPLNVTSRHEIQPRENSHSAPLPPLPSRFSPSLPFPSSSLIFPPSTGQRSPSSSLIRIPLISPLPSPPSSAQLITFISLPLRMDNNLKVTFYIPPSIEAHSVSTLINVCVGMINTSSPVSSQDTPPLPAPLLLVKPCLTLA